MNFSQQRSNASAGTSTVVDMMANAIHTVSHSIFPTAYAVTLLLALFLSQVERVCVCSLRFLDVMRHVRCSAFLQRYETWHCYALIYFSLEGL